MSHSVLTRDEIADAPQIHAVSSRQAQCILIGTDTYPPDMNGAGQFSYRLAVVLAQRGHDVHVVCVSDTGPSGINMMDGVTVHRLRSIPTMVYPSLRFVAFGTATDAVRRIFDQVKPDVVHLQSHFAVGRTCLEMAKHRAVPVVATNHFMPEPLLRHSRLPQSVQSWAARMAWRDAAKVFARADHVTTPTQIAAQLFNDNGFTGEIEPVSCGIDLSRFQLPDHPPSSARQYFNIADRKTILFVGRLDDEKRIGDLIASLRRLRDTNDVQLVVAGVGPQHDKLEQLAAELDVSLYVNLLGYVTNADLPHLYHAAEVFAIASVAELQSIVTLEAMASGLPVVGADAVALPHLIKPGRNGYLFAPGDVSDLTAQLRHVLSSESDLRAMSATSRALAARHDHEASVQRFEDIYTALSQKVGSRS